MFLEADLSAKLNTNQRITKASSPGNVAGRPTPPHSTPPYPTPPHPNKRQNDKKNRRELWQRTLLRGEAGGPSPVEVERLISRYAGEKGIVDPTNTPIAGMVATGVRHRAAEAFSWLARGG